MTGDHRLKLGSPIPRSPPRRVGLHPRGSLPASTDNAFSRDKVTPTLDGVSTIWGGGLGLACRAETQQTVAEAYLSDWHSMDTAIGRLGQMLSDGDLEEEISLYVEAVPCAL